MRTTPPPVSVLTPVYNGERYLAECIQSVLDQTYENWEYVIVDNCSADATPRIAADFARRDARIRVQRNPGVLGMPDNWNHTVRQMGAQAKYCKVVHADDWLFPECIEKMVALAEAHPGIGIVGAYIQEGNRVEGDGLPFPSPVLSGKAVCRDSLLGRVPYLFGSPSALLMRADVLRSRDRIYNDHYHQLLDQTACYEILKTLDFGFVHQVLTFHRTHDASQTRRNEEMNKLVSEQIQFLKEYGPAFLSETELKHRIDTRLRQYRRFLLRSGLAGRGNAFWTFHRDRLKALGYTLNSRFMATGAIEELLQVAAGIVKIPAAALQKTLKNGEPH